MAMRPAAQLGEHLLLHARRRSLALARHVHALLLTAHAWHYELPGPRSRALMCAEHLVEYLAPAA